MTGRQQQALLSLLRKLEWSKEESFYDTHTDHCPVCGGMKPWQGSGRQVGHTKNCELKEAIRAFGEESPEAPEED
jgi:hypothetical protein